MDIEIALDYHILWAAILGIPASFFLLNYPYEIFVPIVLVQIPIIIKLTEQSRKLKDKILYVLINESIVIGLIFLFKIFV